MSKLFKDNEASRYPPDEEFIKQHASATCICFSIHPPSLVIESTYLYAISDESLRTG